MSAIAICPKCNKEFNSKEHMKTRVSGVFSFFRQIEKKRFEPLIRRGSYFMDEIKSNLTLVCPACGNEFSFDGYKFFGLFSPSVMKTIIIVFLVLFLAIPIYVIIRELF